MSATVDRFDRDGYVVVPGLVPPRLVGQLRAAIEAAAEPASDNPLSLATMRFASNVFRRSERLRRFLTSDAVVGLVTEVLGPDVWVRWDQAVWKGPAAPVFPWHQDNGYTQLADMHLQLWVALTPMDTENGGLLVQPAGHRSPAEHRWSGNHIQMDPPDEFVALSADAGDVVLFSSFLPHSTTRNETSDDRLAYVAEFLPLTVADRAVEAPHLVVATGGRPDGRMLDLDASGRWQG